MVWDKTERPPMQNHVADALAYHLAASNIVVAGLERRPGRRGWYVECNNETNYMTNIYMWESWKQGKAYSWVSLQNFNSRLKWKKIRSFKSYRPKWYDCPIGWRCGGDQRCMAGRRASGAPSSRPDVVCQFDADEAQSFTTSYSSITQRNSRAYKSELIIKAN
jgi:hypothetical protein